MAGVEKVFQGKKLIAIIFRGRLKVKNIEFFTDPSNPFQIGAHNRKKGVKLNPHIHHIEKPLTINSIQEWLFVTKGKIKVTLYEKSGKITNRKTLKSGDSILLMEGGHGVDLLEDSQIFEIKQGPFLNSHHSKIFFK
jgi:hypothetical protein